MRPQNIIRIREMLWVSVWLTDAVGTSGASIGSIATIDSIVSAQGRPEQPSAKVVWSVAPRETLLDREIICV